MRLRRRGRISRRASVEGWSGKWRCGGSSRIVMTINARAKLRVIRGKFLISEPKLAISAKFLARFRLLVILPANASYFM
jgi:hypothetical protein